MARDAFWLWNLYGRPNQGQLYHSMRSSRAHFKYALMFAKRIEDTVITDALAKDLGGQKHDDFWKSVSKINQRSQLHATIATYCCNLYYAPFWYDSTKAAIKKLKVAYNNSLRRLLGLPSHNSAIGIFVNLNIPSFGELLRKYVYSFRNRLESSENSIIRGIYLSQFLLQSGIWVWWRDILSP